MSLSERIRPGVEAAPWVIHEIMELETALAIIQERHSASLEALKLAAQINPFGSVENAAARDAARAMMPTAHVPEVPAEPTPLTYSYSTDDELYHGEFDSPDAAAADAFYDDPELEAASVGENRKHTAHFYVSADRILEDVTERAYDECGEASEDWLDGVMHNVDKKAELEKLVGDWLQAQESPNFWRVANTRQITRAEMVAAGKLDSDAA